MKAHVDRRWEEYGIDLQGGVHDGGRHRRIPSLISRAKRRD
jgi:hypothetical protein